MKWVWAGVAVVALAAGGAVLVRDGWQDSLTYDELGYIQSGICTIETGVVDEKEPTNPPLFKLAAGAAATTGPVGDADCETAGARFEPTDLSDLREYTFRSRLPSIAITLVLFAAIGALGVLAAGWPAGALAVVVAATEPNLLAHGHLVTADIWLTTAFAVAVASHWAARRWNAPALLAVTGVAVGCGLLSKATALVLLPLLVGLDAWRWVRAKRAPRAEVLALAGALVVAFAVLWLPYVVLDQPGDFRGEEVASVRFGLPGAWVAGVEFQAEHARSGYGATNYLNGSRHDSGRLPHYYLEAIALKGSLVLLGGVAVGVYTFARRRDADGAAWLAVPAALLIAVPSAGVVHIGLRYALPAFPFLCAIAGAGWAALAAREPRSGTAVPVAVAVLVVGLLPLGEPTIASFNALAGSRPERFLADSNLDWGQDAWRVREWWQSHGEPSVVDLTFGPAPLGFYAIPTVDADAACTLGAPAVAVVSLSRHVLESDLPVGARVAKITNAVAIYDLDCPNEPDTAS